MMLGAGRRALTLIELLIVVVIVAILAGVGIPSYTKSIEKSRARSAQMTLKLIRNGERMYKLEQNVYLSLSESSADSEWQKIQMENPNVVNASSGYRYSAPSTSPFEARARRIAGTAAGQYYSINEAGTITASSSLLPVPEN